ncbi:hypothetical protein J6590_070828 [Homalodisca vitripennis]|nr:hypothetical protein J6590_070828 [Homalodisca vitripennis]
MAYQRLPGNPEGGEVTNPMESLVKANGDLKVNRKETLELLLEMHFPRGHFTSHHLSHLNLLGQMEIP